MTFGGDVLEYGRGRGAASAVLPIPAIPSIAEITAAHLG